MEGIQIVLEKIDDLKTSEEKHNEKAIELINELGSELKMQYDLLVDISKKINKLEW